MLENINSIDDLKKLDINQLPTLCEEIRQFIIPNVLHNGGHLSSNLGVVELTVALHYVFDERDKIVWDVGHQSYIHKILTGRKDLFDTLRLTGGISGFPDTKESEQDVFNTGHSSTAISAALGLATARDLEGDNYNVIAVVGDGALTGGESYEALNNVSDKRIIVVFNDNEMSINKSIGVATGGFSKLRVGKYDLRKSKTKTFFSKIPLLGKPIVKFCSWCKRVFKYGIMGSNLYFNSFDMKYIGVIDGHNIKQLIYYLTGIRDNVVKPTLLHIKTVKGKGYQPAEAQPDFYHGINSQNAVSYNTMSNIVGQTLCQMAKDNDKIFAITAAMTDGCGLTEYAEKYPKRFCDVGIAEQHAVTYAAALAKSGFRPYFAVYSTFLQRGFDQVLHDVCLQNLPVVFCIDRSGLVGSDGKTHQGIFDLSYLSCLPNMTILAPVDDLQLCEMLLWSERINSPLSIRYPKQIKTRYSLAFSPYKWTKVDITADKKKEVDHSDEPYYKVDLSAITKPKVKPKANFVILPVGNNCLTEAIKAENILDKSGIAVDIYYPSTVLPLDAECLDSLNATLIVTVEENELNGGFGSLIAAYFADATTKVRSLAVPNTIVEHATIEEQMEQCHLVCEDIVKTIKEF